MAMNYQSRRYALLNVPAEVNRHARRVREFLRPRATDRVLEVGCGRGFLTKAVRRFAPHTTGVDVNRESIANAVAGGLRVMDARRLEFPDCSFDKIYSFHVIEHVPDLASALGEIDRVLKPGGEVLLVYPAEPIRGLYVVPTAIVLFGNPWRARDLHVHKLTPRRLSSHLQGTSLNIMRSALHLLLTPQFVTVLKKDAVTAAARALTPARTRRVAVNA